MVGACLTKDPEQRWQKVNDVAITLAWAIDLVVFSAHDRQRPVLDIDDHSRVLRFLLREMIAECRPRHTLLVGHGGQADRPARAWRDRRDRRAAAPAILR